MSLTGNLSDVPLFDIIQMLELGNRTGVLHFKGARYVAKIYFEKGKIRFAKSMGDYIEKLGEILVRKGYLSPKKLEKVLKEYFENKQYSNKRLGEYLDSKGIVGYSTIKKVVTYQIKETIYKILTEKMGTYTFENQQLPETEDIFINKSSETILMEAVRRLDEWEKIKEKIGGLNKRYKISKSLKTDNINIDFTFEEWKVFVNFTGVLTLEDIARKTKLDSFTVSKITYALYNLGVITPVEKIKDFEITNEIDKKDINDIRRYIGAL